LPRSGRGLAGDFVKELAMRFTITLVVLGLLAGGLLTGKQLRGDDEKKPAKKAVKEEADEDKKAASEESIDLKKLPDGVLEATKKAFPGAEVVGAAKEKDGDKTIYEVELKQKGMTIDISFNDKGVMELVEKQIAIKSVPEAVSGAVSKKYPGSTIKLAEELYKVAGGKQTLDVYELLIETADKNGVEIKLTPKGEIKEEEQKGKAGGDEKKEEPKKEAKSK
jgi:hypothetical protein